MGWIKRAIKLMLRKDAESPILLNISSYGGSVYDGLGLYDMIRKLPCPVYTHCEGYAMSMGLVLFVAGDVRTAEENSTFMAHSVSSIAGGKAFEIDLESKEVNRLNKLMAKLLSERTNRDAKWWEKEIKYEDKYYNVVNAKKLGIL
jgi:ATP-dependent Clp protease protease subunit